MRVLPIISFVLWFATLTPVPQAPTSSVDGTVMQFGTGDGLSGARVTLIPAGVIPAVPAFTTTSDSSGRFVFQDVPPKTYIVRAERAGYISSEDRNVAAAANFFSALGVAATPSTTVTYASATIRVDPKQRVQVTLFLVPTGVLSGHVIDDKGRPLVNHSVDVFGLMYRFDRKLLVAIPLKVVTDDRGEYRVFPLQAGEYYVRVRPDASKSDGFAPTYYPRTTELALAHAVVIHGTSEFNGADIVVQRSPTVRVAGKTLIAETNAPLRPGEASEIYLVPLDPNAASEPPLAFPNEAKNKSEGEFEIRGVHPGNYNLFPVLQGQRGSSVTGPTAVKIGEQDVTNVTAVVKSYGSISGRINAEGGGVISGAQIVLEPTTNQPLVGWPPNATWKPGAISSDGTFVVQSIPEGPYQIKVSSLPLALYVADIRQEGRSILNDGVYNVGPQPGNLEIIVRSGSGILEGTVSDSVQSSVPSAVVILVPQSPKRKNFGMYRRVITDSSGKFIIRSITPGEYKVFAFESIPNSVEQSVQFLQQFELLGQTITIDINGRPVKQLRLIKIDSSR